MCPQFVAVVLDGGPCDGQIVNVSPSPGGHMPRCFQACLPAPPRDRDVPPTLVDYYSYIRVGGARSTAYRYWRDTLARDAEQ